MTQEILVSTRERPGMYDGLESAKPGEPLFTVQGGDPFGPATVLHWANLARAAGMKEANAEAATRLIKKAGAAEEVAWAMQAYQRGEAPVEERRVSYSGNEAATDQSVLLARIADRLHNSIAEISDQVTALAGQRLHPEAEVMLREAVEKVRAAAFAIEPRRHLRRETVGG